MKFLKEFTLKIVKIRLFKNNGHVFRSWIKFQKWHFSNIIKKMIYHLQHFEILVKCVKSEHFNGIFLQYF